MKATHTAVVTAATKVKHGGEEFFRYFVVVVVVVLTSTRVIKSVVKGFYDIYDTWYIIMILYMKKNIVMIYYYKTKNTLQL